LKLKFEKIVLLVERGEPGMDYMELKNGDGMFVVQRGSALVSLKRIMRRDGFG
jgi:hypothetical protein